MNIRLALIDNDYVIRAKTDLILEREKNKFMEFVKEMDEELGIGNSACLEIGDSKFEISKTE